MKYIGVKGDVLADLNEDLAADAAIMQAQQHGFLSKNKNSIKK
jgi:Mn-containing catalase